MKTAEIHKWDVTPAEAKEIQLRLREKVVLRDDFSRVGIIAGADVAFIQPQARSWERGTGRAIAAVLLYRFPTLDEIERATADCDLTFPYVPGLLSFREIPALLNAFEQLHHKPDLIFCDAHGVAHPRRFGLASHLGVLLDTPAIGCAKSRLTGKYREPGVKAAAWTPLYEEPAKFERKAKRTPEIIGAALRTVDRVRPIFVSQGHRVSLRSAIRFTLAVCDGRRVPRPTRDADRLAALAKRAASEN